MKQTNNAIKFLMAQYRAIFQNAYFKGLATAAVVTMGLAAGQAQAATEKPFDGTADVPTGANPTIIINSDTDKDQDNTLTNYSKINVTASQESKFADVAFQINKGAATANKFDGQAGTALSFKAKSLSIEADDKAHGLTVTSAGTSAQNKAEIEFTQNVTINKGTLAVGGTATGTATVKSTEFNVGKGEGASAQDDAKIALSKLGSIGNEITASSALSELSTVNLKSGGTITTVVAKAQDKGTINAGTFNVTGGDIVSVSGGSNEAGILELNLVQGTISAGNVKVDKNSALNINFKEAKAAAGSTQTAENKLDITGGSISGAGAIVVSGDATTKGVLTINAGENGVNLENATGDLKIASGAIFETDKANLDNLAASSLKTTISGGTLKFSDTANIDLDKAKFNTNGADHKIGLSDSGTILGNELTLNGDIGEVIVEATKLNLKNSTTNALSNTAVKASKTLVVGAESKVKFVTLSAGDLAKIKKQVDDANPGLGADALKAKYAEALLKESGDIVTAADVANGKLDLSATGSKLDVVNGTWTNNSVEVVLGDNSSATASLNVGPEATTAGVKNAAALTFGDGSKLTIASGAVAVGNSTSTTLVGATLDISALDTPEELTFTKGSITAEKNGTIIADSSLLSSLGTRLKI